MRPEDPFALPPIAAEIWDLKYRLKAPDGTAIDATPDDTFRRVARAVALAEQPAQRAKWEVEFHSLLASYRFLPAVRILSGAGTGRSRTRPYTDRFCYAF